MLEIGGKKIKLQIWDTSGSERFRTITTAYYRGATGIILVYDVTKEHSFENLTSWMKDLERHASAGVVKMIIGNMCDMEVWTPPPRACVSRPVPTVHPHAPAPYACALGCPHVFADELLVMRRTKGLSCRGGCDH